MPYLHEQLAGDSGNCGVPLSFSSQKSPSPLSQRRMASHAQDCLSSLNEQVTHITAPSSANADFDPLVTSALALSGIEPDVGHQFLWSFETANVANDRQKSKGIDHSD